MDTASEAALEELNENDDEEDIEAAQDVDADREISDAAMIDEVGDELDDDVDIPELSQAEINLGRFSIHKVFPTAALLSFGTC